MVPEADANGDRWVNVLLLGVRWPDPLTNHMTWVAALTSTSSGFLLCEMRRQSMMVLHCHLPVQRTVPHVFGPDDGCVLLTEI